MGNQAGRTEGKPGSESGRAAPGKPLWGGSGKKGKEAQRLSSQNPKLKRAKAGENSGGQKVNGEKRKETEAEGS